MINPTPLLRPSPLDISGLFAGSFEALKRRLGLFVLLVLFPTLLAIVLFVAVAVIGASATASANQSVVNNTLIVVGLLLFVGLIVVWLAQLKSYAMMSQAAYEIAQGQRPDFAGLLSRTKGFLPRFVPLILIGVAAIIAVCALFAVLLMGLIGAAMSSRDSSTAIASALGILALVVLVAIPLAVFISTRLLYVVPSATIEQLGGIDAVKRSWHLTRGSFWRTLGYWILPQLAVGAVLWVVNLLTSAIGPQATSMDPGASPAEAMALFATALPFLLFGVVLQLAVQLLTTPFLQSYNTYMFIDQVRRNEQGGAEPQGAFGYGAQTGLAYGQQYPQQGYPTSGQGYPAGGQYPVQGYPGGGQYPVQGQPYPGQAPAPQYPPAGSPGQAYPAQPQQNPSQSQWPGQQQGPGSGQPGNQWGTPDQGQPPSGR